VREGPRSTYIGSGREERRIPVAWPSMAATLMEIKGGGGLWRGNGRLKRENEGGASLQLDGGV
jgi:hypothetical protein